MLLHRCASCADTSYPDMDSTGRLSVSLTSPLMLKMVLSRVGLFLVVLLGTVLVRGIVVSTVVGIWLSTEPLLCVRKQRSVRPLLSVSAKLDQCRWLGMLRCP